MSNTTRSALSSLQIQWEYERFAHEVHTAQETAVAIGCDLDQVVKSLLFSSHQSGKLILILLAGSSRLDIKMFEKQTNLRLIRVSSDEIFDKTGFMIGAIPPVGFPVPLETYIDDALLSQSHVWAGTGERNSVCKIPANKLLKLTDGTIFTS